jgi:hypothetical protein
MKVAGLVKRVRSRVKAGDIDPPAPGGPTVTYAGILDGERLWLAVDADAGVLALRDQDSGDLVELESDLPDDAAGPVSVRADLSGLAGEGPATYDVLLVPARGRPQLLLVPPLPDTPTQTPPTRDGRFWLAVRRADDGTLKVTRRLVREPVELVSLTVVPGGVELVLARVPGEGKLLLRTKGQRVLATYPLVHEGERARGVLTTTGLPPEVAATKVVVQGTEGPSLIRRRANGLSVAGRAVVLPELRGDGARLRLRWSPDGFLGAQLRLEQDDLDELDDLDDLDHDADDDADLDRPGPEADG